MTENQYDESHDQLPQTSGIKECYTSTGTEHSYWIANIC